MKAKFLLAALLMGASISCFAQGYKDGIDFYKIGDYENAKVILDKELANASNKAEALYYEGQVAFKEGKGDLAAAKNYYDQGVAADPTYPYNYVGQGLVALKNGDKNTAEDLFKEARSHSKKNPKLEIAIARAYYDANPVTYEKQISKSILQARKWKADDPDAYIFEGDMSEDKQDWGDAQGKYEFAMNYDPANIEATVKYADTYFRVNPELGISTVKGIVDAHPKSALVQRTLAEMLYAHGDYAEASDRYARYINSSTNYFPKDQARYGQLLYFANKYQQAYDVATKLKNSVPAGSDYDFGAQRLQLYALGDMGRWQDAYEVGKKMFTLNTDLFNDKDYRIWGFVLEKIGGHAEESAAAYAKSFEMNPKNLGLLRMLIQQNVAAQNYAAALNWGDKLLNSPEKEVGDYNLMAYVYASQANEKSLTQADRTAAVTQGLAYVDKALAQNPDDVNYLRNKAWLEMESETNGGSKGGALATMQKLESVVKSSTALSEAGKKSILSWVYNYMYNYYVDQKDSANCLDIITKWHEVEPDNTLVTQIFEKLTK